MDEKELLGTIAYLAEEVNLPDTSNKYLAGLLASVLLEYWDGIDENARIILMTIAGTLRKSFVDETLSNVRTEVLLSKMRGLGPVATVNGKKTYFPDHQFTVEVMYDAEAKVWIASCSEIGAFTEAETVEELQERFQLIATDMALENSKMTKRETAVFTFVQRTPA